jgi:hypothetical protein
LAYACKLAEQGLTRLHATSFDECIATIRKRPAMVWEFIAEQVEKQGGTFKIIHSRLPADPKMLGIFTKLNEGLDRKDSTSRKYLSIRHLFAYEIE